MDLISSFAEACIIAFAMGAIVGAVVCLHLLKAPREDAVDGEQKRPG